MPDHPTAVLEPSALRSPRIVGFAWGRIDIEEAGSFRDAKLFPGGVREWDWRETGTAHVPGIQPDDVRELLDHGATSVVLSRGQWKRLQICPETLQLLADEACARTSCLPRRLSSFTTSCAKVNGSPDCFIRPASPLCVEMEPFRR
jgi:hypothetical protein